MTKATKHAVLAGIAVLLFAAGIRSWMYLGSIGKFPPEHLAIEIGLWLLLGLFAFLYQFRAEKRKLRVGK